MSVLGDEILNDPTGKGYAQSLPDQPGAVVDLLNAKTETRLGLLTRRKLTMWAVATGMRAVISDEATDVGSPLRSSALAILDVVQGASDGIDFAESGNIDVINAWEAMGKLSAPHKAYMLALATVPASRMEVLGLPYATEDILRSR